MAISMQVIYPTAGGTRFDFDYYGQKHLPMVEAVIGRFLQGKLVTRGLASGPDSPPAIHAIATMIFADQAAFDAAMAVAGPVMADIANFTDVTPEVLIGEVIA